MWKEVKKEFDVDNEGKEILKKITREKTFSFLKIEKDYWEFIFKATGLFVLAGTIIGIFANFNSQQKQLKQQITQQRAILEIEIYRKAIKNISIIVNEYAHNENTNPTVHSEFVNEILPSALLLNDDTLSEYVNKFGSLYIHDFEFRNMYDSLVKMAPILTDIASKTNENALPKRDLELQNLVAKLKKAHVAVTNFHGFIERTRPIYSNDLINCGVNDPKKLLDSLEKTLSNVGLMLTLIEYKNTPSTAVTVLYDEKYAGKINKLPESYRDLALTIEKINHIYFHELNDLRNHIAATMIHNNSLLDRE